MRPFQNVSRFNLEGILLVCSPIEKIWYQEPMCAVPKPKKLFCTPPPKLECSTMFGGEACRRGGSNGAEALMKKVRVIITSESRPRNFCLSSDESR